MDTAGHTGRRTTVTGRAGEENPTGFTVRIGQQSTVVSAVDVVELGDGLLQCGLSAVIQIPTAHITASTAIQLPKHLETENEKIWLKNKPKTRKKQKYIRFHFSLKLNGTEWNGIEWDGMK